MLFKDLLENINVLELHGQLDVPVQSICYDSRKAQPGSLFVAVAGFRTDGHRYIQQAVANGAVAVVLQDQNFVPEGIPWARVTDSRQAMAVLSAAFYHYPANKLTMVGVTGTNGKTTTTYLIASIYKAAGFKTGIIGTIHNVVGGKELPVTNTTPESMDLQSLLAQMVKSEVQCAVMEVSSHALALDRVKGVEYDVAVFTNITQDHLDFHRDMDDYLAAKSKLFRGLGQGSPVKENPKYAVINADDPAAAKLIAVSGGQVYTYGIDQPADVKARDVRVTARGVSFAIASPWGSFDLNMKLIGKFNVYNTLAAFTAGLAAGFAPTVVIGALEQVSGVAGRFETVDRGQDFAVIVDYAHTPDGLENILKTARQITRGRLITVFGCGGDRDRTKRPIMGGIAAKFSDFSLLTSDNPRTEDPVEILKDVEVGLQQAGPDIKYRVERDRRQAILQAVGMARSGDVVMIAGKGHEDYQIIGTTKYPFDDRLVAVEALAQLGYGK